MSAGVLKIRDPSFTVHRGDLRQVIDGFGASETYLGPVSDGVMDLLFDATTGIGLSLMRIGIASDGGTMGTWANVTKAVARGAKIIALPWTAAAAQKDNGDEFNGGHLLVPSYGAWSTTLAAFQAALIANTSGVTSLYALSVQSEPDWSAAYATMLYTDAELIAFLKVLGPKVAALSPRPLLVAPDTASWSGAWATVDAILADATAAPYLTRVAAHQYAGMSAPSGNWTGRRWMTEMSTFDAFDGSMVNGLVVAAQIHAALTTGNASAWIYWWMVRTGATDNQGLHDTTTPTKRLYVLGHWSKFVRPDFVRLGTTGTVSGVSAGLAATDRKLVPYGALVATFHTGLGCLLGPSLLFFAVKSLVG